MFGYVPPQPRTHKRRTRLSKKQWKGGMMSDKQEKCIVLIENTSCQSAPQTSQHCRVSKRHTPHRGTTKHVSWGYSSRHATKWRGVGHFEHSCPIRWQSVTCWNGRTKHSSAKRVSQSWATLRSTWTKLKNSKILHPHCAVTRIWLRQSKELLQLNATYSLTNTKKLDHCRQKQPSFLKVLSTHFCIIEQ